MKKILLVLNLLFLSFYLLAQTAPNDGVSHLRGNNGTTYTFTTTGINTGSIWGGADGVYTDDTRLGIAAVHAGVLRIGQTGTVSITIMSGRGSYQGNTRNGITAKDYGAWTGSYKFGNVQNVIQEVTAAPANMASYRGNNGTTYNFSIVGSNDGSIWGGANGIYTDDSKLSTAVVHAGLLRAGQSGNIKVTVVQGQGAYQGSTQNGITSNNYGTWHGSYSFGNVGQANNNNAVLNAPANLTEYRGNNGSVYTFRVTGSNAGSVWGGANGIYSDDSQLGVAAVHAGMVRVGEVAVIRVRILKGEPKYRGNNKNGISTSDYGSWHGSFKFE